METNQGDVVDQLLGEIAHALDAGASVDLRRVARWAWCLEVMRADGSPTADRRRVELLCRIDALGRFGVSR